MLGLSINVKIEWMRKLVGDFWYKSWFLVKFDIELTSKLELFRYMRCNSSILKKRRGLLSGG